MLPFGTKPRARARTKARSQATRTPLAFFSSFVDLSSCCVRTADSVPPRRLQCCSIASHDEGVRGAGGAGVPDGAWSRLYCFPGRQPTAARALPAASHPPTNLSAMVFLRAHKQTGARNGRHVRARQHRQGHGGCVSLAAWCIGRACRGTHLSVCARHWDAMDRKTKRDSQASTPLSLPLPPSP